MPAVSNRATAMLIVKIWREQGLFRATISSSTDLDSVASSDQVTASNPDEVLSAVDRWLQSV